MPVPDFFPPVVAYGISVKYTAAFPLLHFSFLSFPGYI